MKAGKLKLRAEIDRILGIKYCYFSLRRMVFNRPYLNCSQEVNEHPICCRFCKEKDCPSRCLDHSASTCYYATTPVVLLTEKSWEKFCKKIKGKGEKRFPPPKRWNPNEKERKV